MDNQHSPNDSPRFQKFKEAIALFFSENPISFNVNKKVDTFSISL